MDEPSSCERKQAVVIYAFPWLLLLIGLLFWASQRRGRPRRTRYLDLGSVFLAVILLYGIVPGIGFLLAHLGIGEIRDTRVSSGFDPAPVERVQFMFICFATSFAVTYRATRRFSRVQHDHRHEAARSTRTLTWFAIALAVGLPLIQVALVGKSEDYISSYASLRNMPLVVQQLFGIAAQLSFSSLVAAVVFAVAARPEHHIRVAMLIGAYIVYATLSGGSRSTAFLCFFAYLVTASIYVRGFSMRKIVAMGAPALALFMLAGLFRDQASEGSYLGVFQSGEFTSLFINAVDLHERFESGFASEVRFAFYLVDVIRIIPAQLVGGVKLDPAAWYVETFYPEFHDAGGGLAFGLLAESVAGYGAAEAAARGALLGLLFAWAANRLLDGQASVVKVFVYVWLAVMSYQSFRDTTLSLGVRALYQVVPMLLLIQQLQRPRQRRAAPRSITESLAR
jgi:hypothetical protein